MQANPKRLAKKVVRSLFRGRRVAEQKKTSSMPKSVLILDTNIGFDHAYALSQAGVKVYFCIPEGPSGFPLISDFCSGDGFKGINKPDEEEEAIDKVDFVMVTDCFFGKKADKLRADGVPVFGPSRALADVENKRIHGWRTLKGLGIGVPDGEITVGLDGFLKYVSKIVEKEGEQNLYPHLDKYRGNGETGVVKNYATAVTMISQLGFGPYLTDLELLVLRECGGEEAGLDIFFNGRDYLRPFLYTIEIKGSGTIGVWVDHNDLDELILDKIKPLLIESGYCGSISFEFFWDGIIVRVHDPTCRIAFPCSSIWTKFITNYPEVAYAVARGEDIEVKIGKKYVSQIGVYTEDIKTWRPIEIPDKAQDLVGFRSFINKAGFFFLVRGDNVAPTAMGSGDTAKDALEECVKVAGQIKCSNSYYPGDFINKMSEEIQKLNALKGNMGF